MAKKDFSTDQFISLKKVLLLWKKKYPKAKIVGHKDFYHIKKTCPNFDVALWCKKREFNLSDKNKTINTSIADVKKKNTQNSELETQCLFGEQITVLQTEKNWSFCKLKLDGYLGWIKNKSFGDYFKTDHIISNPQTFIYKEPYYNSGIIFKLFMNSKIKILKVMGNWVKIYINKNKIGYVPKNHIRKKNEIKKKIY